jgi:tripartite-type tricarboxylate transporter receptor subunit TctC
MKFILSFITAIFAVSVQANDVKELVSPYAPGGVVSSFARVVQKHLQEDSKISTIVVNKPGADARVGVRYVLDRPADGNTWLMAATGPFLFNHVVYQDPGYQAKDFDMVLPMTQSPSVLVVSNQSGITSFQDFIKQARTKPINCGVSNSGALFLTKYVVSQLRLTQVEIVNFKGASEVSTALMSGTIECSFDTIQSQLQFHNSGRLKILAVSSDTINPAVPSATLFSKVIPGFSFYSWYGVAVRKDTPLRDKALMLNALRALNDNESYRNSVQSLGLELGRPVQDPEQWIQRQYQRWEAVRQQAGIEKLR